MLTQNMVSRHLYSLTRLLLAKILRSDNQLRGTVKEPNKFHNYETEKITRKASDAAEYIELFWFFHQRSSRTTHLMLFSKHPPIYASCMMISGGRTEQHVVIGFGELAAVN